MFSRSREKPCARKFIGFSSWALSPTHPWIRFQSSSEKKNRFLSTADFSPHRILLYSISWDFLPLYYILWDFPPLYIPFHGIFSPLIIKDATPFMNFPSTLLNGMIFWFDPLLDITRRAEVISKSPLIFFHVHFRELPRRLYQNSTGLVFRKQSSLSISSLRFEWRFAAISRPGNFFPTTPHLNSDRILRILHFARLPRVYSNRAYNHRVLSWIFPRLVENLLY